MKNKVDDEYERQQLNILAVSDSFINSVKKEMLDWYGFDLTYEQVKKYLEINKLDFFDTVEREGFSDFLGRTITGMSWPWNGHAQDYKDEFFRKLKENSEKYGYVWLI